MAAARLAMGATASEEEQEAEDEPVMAKATQKG